MKRAYGFTIVELLIVIVVIAILAAISIVAYNGVSSSANDSAVKADLANMAKRIQMEHANAGEYPRGGGYRESEGGAYSGDSRTFTGFQFSPTKPAYFQSTSAGAANFIYCTGPVGTTSQQGFAIYAQSKSMKSFRFSSMNGLEEYGLLSPAVSRACEGLGYTQYYALGFTVNGGGWQSWAQ